MRFVIIHEAGRHAASREIRECLSYQRALRRLGHEACVWGLHQAEGPQGAPISETLRQVDAVLVLENYDETGWVPALHGFAGPVVFVSIDAHCQLAAHQRLCERLGATHVLCASYGYLHAFARLGTKTFWLPNAYDDVLVGPRAGEKSYRLGFCGSYANRGAWLEAADAEVGVRRDIWELGEAMVRAVNSYHVHFNRNVADDINSRTFETTGCGTMLLTNYTPGLEQLFKIGEEIVVYRDLDDLRHKARYYTAHLDETREIARHGLARAARNHTFLERARQICHILHHSG